MSIYYYGVWEAGGGNILHRPGSEDHCYGVSFPFNYSILGYLLPKSTEKKEGVVHSAHINGWTILSFWDRSSDSPHAFVSAFILEGNINVVMALQEARKQFPNIFERFKFEITIAPSAT